MLKSLNFELRGNSYKIEYPNVGQIRDIEALKAQLSNGYYLDIWKQGVNGAFAADIIEIQATFSVLCPRVLKDLYVDNVGDLVVKDMVDVIKAYKEQYIPFMEQWQEIINDLYLPKKEEKEDEN